MKRAWLSFGALGLLLGGVVGAGVACGSSDNGPGTTLNTDTGIGGDTGVTPKDTSVSETTDSGTPSDTTPGDTPVDGFTGPPACPTTVAEGKLAEFNDPASGKTAKKGNGIHVNVVATSGKFIVSKSKKSLKCLYGVFAVDANTTFAPYSGIVVVSEGNNGTIDPTTGSVHCSDGDLIPLDVKPGDMLDVTGTYDIFGPTAATCGAATPPLSPPTPAKAPQLSSVCKLTRTAGGTVPAPLDVSSTDLAGGASSPVLKYSGGWVRIKNVTATTATAPGDSSFGAFKVDPGGLQIVDTIYYRGAATAPVVKVGDKFDSIVGESYLDFCSWSLAPVSRCGIAPPPTGADAGADAGDAGSCP